MSNNAQQVSTVDLINQIAGGDEPAEMPASKGPTLANTPAEDSEVEPKAETIEVKDDGNKDSAEENKEGSEKGQESQELLEKGAEGETKVTPSATVKAKAGEKEVELDDGTVFTVKIDKKDESVTLKELIRQYQGKVPLEKHYGALKKDRADFEAEKKTFLEEKGVVESRMKELVELLATDPKKALEKIVLYSGKNPGEFESIYADEMDGMTDKEREIFLREKKLEHKEAQSKVKDEQAQTEKAKAELAKVVADTLVSGQKQYGLSDAEIETAWNYTLAQSKAGKLDLTKLSGEQIGNVVVRHVMEEMRPAAIFVQAAKKVGYTEEVTPDDVKFLKTLLFPGAEWDDIADIVKAYYNLDKGSEAGHTKAQEPSTERATKPTSRKVSLTQKAQDAEDEDEDDDPKSFADLLSSARRGRR